MNGSKPFNWSWTDGWKVIKGGLLAAGGAGLAYFSQWVTDTDFGQWTPVVTAVAAIGLNAARKWLMDTTDEAGTDQPRRLP